MRKTLDLLFTVGTGLCAVAAVSIIGIVFAALLFRGLPAVNWRFLTEQIRMVGADGGIFYNLVGTIILTVTALLVCSPVAIGVALIHSVYLPQNVLSNSCQLNTVFCFQHIAQIITQSHVI